MDGIEKYISTKRARDLSQSDRLRDELLQVIYGKENSSDGVVELNRH